MWSQILCKKDEREYRLEVYKVLYKAYADEIRNLWQRSIFLGAFMTLAWGGYGALQLKFIESSGKILQNTINNNFDLEMYHCFSVTLCFVIMILSLLWVAMAKGSKFVQEAHEWHIKNLKIDDVEKDIKKLFCNLDNYDKHKHKKCDIEDNISSRLFFNGDLESYRYSPSKINIALGRFSFFVSLPLIIYHTIFTIIFLIKCKIPHCIIFGVTVVVIAVLSLIAYRLNRLITFKDLKGKKINK